MIVMARATSYDGMREYLAGRGHVLDQDAAKVERVALVGVLDRYLEPLIGRGDGRLGLLFEDLDPVQFAPAVSRHAMHAGHARKLVAFLRAEHARPERVLLAAHCRAGVSRSGAIVRFVADVCGLDAEQFERMNPCILPSAHVLRLLHEAWAETKGAD